MLRPPILFSPASSLPLFPSFPYPSPHATFSSASSPCPPYFSLSPFSNHPPPASQQLYMVSVDVSRAFDSIDIQRLLGVVEPTLSSPCYTLLR